MSSTRFVIRGLESRIPCIRSYLRSIYQFSSALQGRTWPKADWSHGEKVPLLESPAPTRQSVFCFSRRAWAGTWLGPSGLRGTTQHFAHRPKTTPLARGRSGPAIIRTPAARRRGRAKPLSTGHLDKSKKGTKMKMKIESLQTVLKKCQQMWAFERRSFGAQALLAAGRLHGGVGIHDWPRFQCALVGRRRKVFEWVGSG